MKFYHAARELRENITLTLPRDFGLRDKIEKTKTADNLEVTVIEGYPRRLIVAFRQNITRLPRNLMMSVTAGNTLYPTTRAAAAGRQRKARSVPRTQASRAVPRLYVVII